MMKTRIAALIAAISLSPAALAEGTPVTLTHTYELDALAEDARAEALLDDLKDTATELCSSRLPVYGKPYVDRTCVDTLFEAAVAQIHRDGAAKGVTFAPAFERAVVTRLASAS